LVHAEMAGHAGARKDARRKARGTDRTRSAIEHRPMAARTAAEMVALDDASEALALADANHVHFVVWLELFHQNAIAQFQVVITRAQLNLTHDARTLGVRFLEMAGF